MDNLKQYAGSIQDNQLWMRINSYLMFSEGFNVTKKKRNRFCAVSKIRSFAETSSQSELNFAKIS